MLTKEQLQAALPQFTGTESYTRHNPFGGNGLLLTDGAKFLAEKAECWWLFDAICSYQPRCQKDEMLRDIQFWTLTIHNQNKRGQLICERDSGDVAIRQGIEFTDFPLDEIKLYVQNGVVLLPSEY
jgi:hypothetical protein